MTGRGKWGGGARWCLVEFSTKRVVRKRVSINASKLSRILGVCFLEQEEFAAHYYHSLICRRDENKSEIGIAQTSEPVTSFQFPEKINSSPLFPFFHLQTGATRRKASFCASSVLISWCEEYIASYKLLLSLCLLTFEFRSRSHVLRKTNKVQRVQKFVERKIMLYTEQFFCKASNMNKKETARFEFRAAVLLKIQAFWDTLLVDDW